VVMWVTTPYILNYFRNKEIKRFMLRYSLFWDVTQRVSVVTDVSGQTSSTIFNIQAITNNQYRLRNIPEERMSHLDRGEDLKLGEVYVSFHSLQHTQDWKVS